MQQPRASVGLEHLGAYRPSLPRYARSSSDSSRPTCGCTLRSPRGIATCSRRSSSTASARRDAHAACALRARVAPEQVKHYLAREIIARLPNASAIDLTQFAGLTTGADSAGATRATTRTCSTSSAATSRKSRNPSKSRWSVAGPTASVGPEPAPRGAPACRERDTARGTRHRRRAGGRARRPPRGAARPSFPAAATSVGKDADLRRRRRRSSTRAGGTASCGSTKERGGSPIADRPTAFGWSPRVGAGPQLASAKGDGKALALEPGSRVVLSASGQGTATQYPRFGLSPRRRGATRHGARR